MTPVERWEWWQSIRSRIVRNYLDDYSFDNIWVGIMLRRYHARSPSSFVHYRTVEEWQQVVQREAEPEDNTTSHFDYMRRFLRRSEERSKSPNPWSVQNKARKRCTKARDGGVWFVSVAEYSIGRVRTLEEDLAYENQLSRQKQRQWAKRMERWALEDLSDLYH